MVLHLIIKIMKIKMTYNKKKEEVEEVEEIVWISNVNPTTGRMLETVVDHNERKTGFILREENTGEIKRLNEYDHIGPLKYSNGMIKNRFIKLSSDIQEYGNPIDLFGEIKEFITKYVEIPTDFINVCTTYAMLTFVYDKFRTIPYLRVVGTFGTGKTRFQEVMASICYKAMSAGGSISTSAVFRTLDFVRGTLVFDEADFKNSELWSEIIKILNSGHTKDFPVVRTKVSSKGDFTTDTFYVYGPKILASRERFSDSALESRCISLQMMPLKNVSKPVHLKTEFEEESLKLRNKLLKFRFDNFLKVEEDESTVENLNFPRVKQTALALTSVARFVSEEVLNSVIEFLKNTEKDLMNQQKTDDKADVIVAILEVIRKRKNDSYVEDDDNDFSKLRIGTLASQFNGIFYEDYAEKETKEYQRRNDNPLVFRGQKVSPKKIGGLVHKLGINTDRDCRGVYIPMDKEMKRITSLAERYGLEDYIKEKNAEESEYDIEPQNVSES